MMRAFLSVLAAMWVVSAQAQTTQPVANVVQPGPGIVVMSYNICWDCQTVPRSTQGRGLNGACYVDKATGQAITKPPTSCALAMGKAINGYAADALASGFDFVGFQEASNWQMLQHLADTSLRPMAAIGSSVVAPRLPSEVPHGETVKAFCHKHRHKCNRSEMVNFFDATKYDHLFSFHGDLEFGRPTQADLFEVKSDGSFITFVNVHNCHVWSGCDFDYVKTHLSKIVSEQIKVSGDSSLLPKLAKARVIVVGDFNEAAFADNAQFGPKSVQFSPLGSVLGAGGPISTLVQVLRSPVSCCDDYYLGGGHPDWQCGPPLSTGCRTGDYIFDSQAPASSFVPSSYQYNVNQSDHLPVIAKLAP